ncbi:MAG: hypothetical protein KJ993_07865 [Actinobacteria bacterium]|nr:hypothetical protein [Actinomycetota bacterium]MBU1942954.1 hypothetical protein [Actinomycetota bacterium]
MSDTRSVTVLIASGLAVPWAPVEIKAVTGLRLVHHSMDVITYGAVAT